MTALEEIEEAYKYYRENTNSPVSKKTFAQIIEAWLTVSGDSYYEEWKKQHFALAAEDPDGRGGAD